MPELRNPSAQDLIQALRERGVKMSELAAECDRDPSLLYQVASGKRAGRNLLPTLKDILRIGVAVHRPQRRQTASGEPAQVRGRQGEPAQSPPPATPTTPQAGSFSTQTVYLQGGGRTIRITAPKRRNAAGRAQAKQATTDALRWATQDRRRVAFVVHYSDGTSVTMGAKGGYRANVAWERAEGSDDTFEWLRDEASAVGNRLGRSDPPLSIPIVGVDLTIFGEPDPEQPIPESARPRRRGHPTANDLDIEQVKAMYEAGSSMRAVAEHFGITRYRVRKTLLDGGVATRGRQRR